MEDEEESMQCDECGHTGPGAAFFDFPEEYTFVSYVCPECGYCCID